MIDSKWLSSWRNNFKKEEFTKALNEKQSVAIFFDNIHIFQQQMILKNFEVNFIVCINIKIPKIKYWYESKQYFWIFTKIDQQNIK
jgi:hypothetical protein